MMQPLKILQATPYDAFHCIGADCEDTCCDGWGITVDRITYGKYQKCSDPELGPSLRDLVVINTESSGEDDCAMIKLSETHCPFLADGLCSVQKKLGEEYLSNTCSVYPRIMNGVGDVLERTLDLSCPEAARVVLLGSGPLEFAEVDGAAEGFRIGNLSVPDTPNPSYDGKTYTHFQTVRSLAVHVLQQRAYPLWQRLVILGHLSDKLTEMANQAGEAAVPDVISAYHQAIQDHTFDDLLRKCQAKPEVQLITILELIVSRITSDFTGRRFLECYQEFMQGLEWTQESNLKDIGILYSEAYTSYYASFIAQHEDLMERYLINYVYKNLFPLGRLESNQKAGIHHAENSISVQCMLMMAHYAIIRTLLIGMAGLHKSNFAIDHAIKGIQSTTKAFQHSTSFPARALDILTRGGMKNGASMGVLIQDPMPADPASNA